MSILIRRVKWVDAEHRGQGDLLIEGDRIRRLDADIQVRADEVIDGEGKAAIPGLVNTHTHAAMTLLRGYADDLELMEWLTTRIWPRERKLTPADVYAGARLASLEMLRSGTTAFCDMYFMPECTARAAQELGIRSTVAAVFFNAFESKSLEVTRRELSEALERCAEYPLARPALGPHSVYTVDLEGLAECAGESARRGLRLHLHLAETRGEVEEFRAKHGRGIVEVLDGLGVLTERTVAAHSIWLDPTEIALLGRRRVNVSHCPASNLKLASGRGNGGPPRVFDYRAMKASGVNVTLGTDGAASGNDLDLFGAMRLAALLQKHQSGDPTLLPAHEAFAMATAGGARALGLESGRFAPGALADLVLVDLDRPYFCPGHDLVADLVYAARGDAVHTVIVGGRVLLRNGRVPGQETIMDEARKAARSLVTRI